MRSFMTRLSLPVRIGVIAGLGALGAGTVLLIVGLIAINAAHLVGGVYDPRSNGYILEQDGGSAEIAGATVLYGVPLVVVLAASCGALAWAATRREFAALRQIAEATGSITAQTLDVRVPLPDVPGDVRTVASGVNALLARLSEGFARGSRFASNASHELRTPLAASRTILQVALRAPGLAPGVEGTYRQLLALNDRMVSISDALLDLAAAENTVDETVVDLRPLVADVVASLERDIADRHLRVTVRLDDLSVSGHAALVRQLIVNLVRNAIVHNVERGVIAIAVERQGSAVALTVDNDGELIPTDAVPGLVEPFNRLVARSAGEGHGLGLAIVKQISESHGADLLITRRPQGGLAARVRFPRDVRP